MSNPPPQLHVFDLDGTLCKGNVSFLFGQYLHRQGIISTTEALKSVYLYSLHVTGLLSIEALHHTLFKKIFFQKKLSAITEHVEPFLSLYWEELVHPLAKSFFDKAKLAAQHTALFSSSPSFLIEPIAQRVGFESWLASEYAVDKDDFLCHIALVVDGKKKAAKLLELSDDYGIQKHSITAYSDGENDLPLLQAAGKSIVFHPNRRLLKHCIENNWIALQSYWSPT